jgi:mannobiose 2-epimerase
MTIHEGPGVILKQFIQASTQSVRLPWRRQCHASHPFVIRVQHLVFVEHEPAREEGEFLQRERDQVGISLAHTFAVIPAPRQELRREAQLAIRHLRDRVAHNFGEERLQIRHTGKQNARALERVANGITAACRNQSQEIEVDVFAVNVAVVGAQGAVVVVKPSVLAECGHFLGGDDDGNIDIRIGSREAMSQRAAKQQGEDFGVVAEFMNEVVDGVGVVFFHGVAGIVCHSGRTTTGPLVYQLTAGALHSFLTVSSKKNPHYKNEILRWRFANRHPLRLNGASPLMIAVNPADLLTAIESDLRGNILPFWIKHVVNGAERTFHGALSNDLKIDRRAERGALLTSRILWTYASAHRHYRDASYREMADLAYDDLLARYRDAEHGGFYWSINADGAVSRDRKQVYGQAFAIYALSEYHAATGRREPLETAVALFRLLETHARERVYGGYLEAFARDWTPIADMRLSAVDQNDPKSQNTMLHVMEACTRLLNVWPDAALRAALRDQVEIMLTRIIDPKTSHLGLFFTTEWRPTSDKISYGHDIEAAWLLSRAAEAIGDPTLTARVASAALKIADVTLAEGTDTDGAIFNLGDPSGIIDDSREWWPQAEAVIGFLNAWQLSGEDRYLLAATRTWNYIATHLVDRENGEWFRGVTREGHVIGPLGKVGFWKCPYHNGRMGLEVVARLRS